MSAGRKSVLAGQNLSAVSKKRECAICFRTFAKTEHLERHVRSHTKEKPFRCDICGRSYGRKYVKSFLSEMAILIKKATPYCGIEKIMRRIPPARQMAHRILLQQKKVVSHP